MALSDAATQRAYAATPRRGPVTRLLEDERWLAVVLLLPTVVLLGLFIAYPFVEGVLLAVTDARVGVPGKFVGLQNFSALARRHLPHRRLEHLCLHGRRYHLQTCAGVVARAAPQPPFQGQGLHPGVHPAAFHHPDGAVDLR